MRLLTCHKLVDRSERLERFQLFERIHAHRSTGLIGLNPMREQRQPE
jgi:hypothetical protein